MNKSKLFFLFLINFFMIVGKEDVSASELDCYNVIRFKEDEIDKEIIMKKPWLYLNIDLYNKIISRRHFESDKSSLYEIIVNNEFSISGLQKLDSNEEENINGFSKIYFNKKNMRMYESTQGTYFKDGNWRFFNSLISEWQCSMGNF